MKRIVLVVVLLVGALLIGSPAAFADTCRERPDANAYSCTVKNHVGFVAPDTLTFTTAPEFTVTTSVFGFTLQCACGTAGTFKNPLFFEDQKQWTCVLGVGVGSVEINGNVKGGGGNITDVEGADDGGAGALWGNCTKL